MPPKRMIFTGLFMLCLALGTALWLQYSGALNWAWALVLAFLGLGGAVTATEPITVGHRATSAGTRNAEEVKAKPAAQDQ